MVEEYSAIKITIDEASDMAISLYKIDGKLSHLPGYIDFNFKIETTGRCYILKISRPNSDIDYLKYQQELLQYLSIEKARKNVPEPITDIHGNYVSEVRDRKGGLRIVRLLSWIEGRLWSSVNPQKKELLISLGTLAGSLTNDFQGFEHKIAHYKFDWDIAQADWTFEHLQLFSEDDQKLIKPFQVDFEQVKPLLDGLRKAIVHNDVNDYNILVSNDLLNPQTSAIIDYGDALYTPVINDLAIAIAYAIMFKPDALATAILVAEGYHKSFPLQENELSVLYNLVAMRLVIILTKAAINKKIEPDNKYLLISEKPALEALRQWQYIDKNLAYFSFRKACAYSTHPHEHAFFSWVSENTVNLMTIFPGIDFTKVLQPDMCVGSTWLGHEEEYNELQLFNTKLRMLQDQNENSLLAGGYLEPRAVYNTDAYKKEGINGREYRTIHLGVDFWCKSATAIHAPIGGRVICSYDNNNDKDYGPTIIIEHEINNSLTFYSLYGHLSKKSLNIHQAGEKVEQGELVGYVGGTSENGNWPEHLHFQLMLDMLGNKTDFPGVAFPQELDVWKSICPDPNVLFKEPGLNPQPSIHGPDILKLRKNLLGQGLSLSYTSTLNIVQGRGAFLFDEMGRKFLDTVNNVAHVGHEHPAVVKAGQKQMAVLNTNTRYIHKNITDFASELLSTFPPKLCVVHFVNSGSEAVELALRMARIHTGQKDMIAIELAYHGNTQACIDISSYKFDADGGDGIPEHTHIVPIPDAYRGIYQGEKTGSLYARHIQDQINNIASKGRKIAGFIAESIISCGGQIELPENYLSMAYAAVRDAGGLCIADEVQVGFGRMGSVFWGFQLHDVVPDIVTIGKPIGNGHPLAAVVCTKEVAETFNNGMEYFNTFGGNPVSCAIGREVLRVIKQEKLQENALTIGAYLKKGLIDLQKEFPIIGDVRGQGLFLGFELVGKNKSPLPEHANYIANRMKELGVLMSTDGKDNNVMKIKPPLVFSQENADELISQLTIVLAEDVMQEY